MNVTEWKAIDELLCVSSVEKRRFLTLDPIDFEQTGRKLERGSFKSSHGLISDIALQNEKKKLELRCKESKAVTGFSNSIEDF